MDLGLKDCRAFAAGASKGLGKACAKSLADEGARVFVCSRDEEQISQAAAEIRAVGWSAADVSRAAEVKRVVAEAIAALDGLDILVTKAGVSVLAAGGLSHRPVDRGRWLDYPRDLSASHRKP